MGKNHGRRWTKEKRIWMRAMTTKIEGLSAIGVGIVGGFCRDTAEEKRNAEPCARRRNIEPPSAGGGAAVRRGQKILLQGGKAEGASYVSLDSSGFQR